jgi:hypothetical protein
VTFRAPDCFEPAIGWRVWTVTEDAGQLRLSSVLYPTVWPVRREFVAACAVHAPSGRAPHAVPHIRCGCGVHAAASVDGAASYFDGQAGTFGREIYRVIGSVSLWGSVVEGDRGWRSSHAYPQRLYVPARCPTAAARATAGEIALALTDYGVPVALLEAMTKRGICAELTRELRAAA